MTQKQAMATVRQLGLVLRIDREHGEYVVVNRANGATYHTSDRDDAVATARAMATERDGELARITEQAAKLGLPLWSKGQVDWLTARLHVSAPDAEVRAHFLARMTSAGWTDAMREEAIAYALACHAANREWYNRVMSGTI